MMRQLSRVSHAHLEASVSFTFHGSRVLCQRRKCCGSFIFDCVGRSVQKLRDEQDITCLQIVSYLVKADLLSTYPVRSVRLAIQTDDLDDAHLQQLIHTRNLVEHLNDPLDRLRHGAVREEDERIPLARSVGLRGKEGLNELWCVWNERFVITVDGIDREDSVLPDVGVTVFKA